jgi:hypothetical protein
MRGGFALLLIIAYATSALAMGGPAPKEEEPKYKLEILKMEVVTAPAQSLERPTEEGKSKYKLEILKMDVITAPSPSWEPEEKE